LLLGACGRRAPAAGAPSTVEAWFHTGTEAERRVLEGQVARFNASQRQVQVELTLIPEGGYDLQVQSAALSGELPDLLDLDGPQLAKYVWQGHLRPLDDLLPAELRRALLPSILAQGTYRGQLWAVGTFDSGLGLYGDRAQLAAVGARLPSSPADAWTVDEFDRLLAALAANDADGRVLDLGLADRGEWIPYAFAPILWSAGAGLVDRQSYRTAHGVLDSPQAVAAMERLQGWIERGRVHPNVDRAAFQRREVALSWSGHWRYGAYAEALGDDLVLLPLPDFGHGSRTAQGSWAWALTRRAADPQAAGRFLRFLLQRDEVLAMAAANGAVPGRSDAVARSPLYAPGGPLSLFARQLQSVAMPRPVTPAYGLISAVFQDAFQRIVDGADVEATLARAARAIDRDLQDQRYYGRAAGER
jgi:multiple sugar transport system substrate-binding protein